MVRVASMASTSIFLAVPNVSLKTILSARTHILKKQCKEKTCGQSIMSVYRCIKRGGGAGGNTQTYHNSGSEQPNLVVVHDAWDSVH